MVERRTKTGKALERIVAQAYRDIGAHRSEHDVEVAGHQIDVYVELETLDRGVHRIAIESKDYSSPVGIKIVSDYSVVVDRLRHLRLIDEGVIVSAAGFTKQARNAAALNKIRLIELADLDAIVVERKNEFIISYMRALSDEMTFNLDRLEEFIQEGYRVQNNMIYSKNGENVLMNYFTCMMNVFESNETQNALSTLDEDVKNKLFLVYRRFREINDKANALDHAFRPWRASLYIDAVIDFENNLRSSAESLIKNLHRRSTVGDV